MSYIICSFYTEGKYEEIINTYLRPSIKKLGLESIYYDIRIPNTGNWQKNVANKPECILQFLGNFKEDIIFLDADAEIKQYPVLFEELTNSEYDLSFHLLDRSLWYRVTCSPKFSLLSGTLYLKNNEKIKNLVRTWKDKSLSSSDWEQKVLQKLLPKFELNIFHLPLEYCYIKSLPNGKDPYIKIEQPVIVHNQVSRRFKHKIVD